MKKSFFILYFILFSTVLSCCSLANDANASTKSNISKTVDENSPINWLNDSIYQLNPELFLYADTLFSYIDSDKFSLTDVEKNIEWMNAYMDKICELNPNTLTNSENRNQATENFITLLNTSFNDSSNNDDSKWGMITKNLALKDILILQLYNEFDCLFHKCNSEEKKLLLESFRNWSELENLISELYANLVAMSYWGGSITGSISSAGLANIIRPEVNLLQNENAVLSGNYPISDTGTYIKPARQLLISCVDITIDNLIKPSDIGIERDSYEETLSETQKLAQLLPIVVDQWINSRASWIDQISTDGSRSLFERNTSSVLIQYANLFSTID